MKFLLVQDRRAHVSDNKRDEASGVQIHFRMQKKLSAEEKILMHATGNIICPVWVWVHTVKELEYMHMSLAGVVVNK